MFPQPRQQSLFPGPHTGTERIDITREDRYVLTQSGQVIVNGTHAECMEFLHEHLSGWRIEHEEDRCLRLGQPYTKRVLVGWALIGEEKGFLWQHQQLFSNDHAPDATTGLSLFQFLLARSRDCARIYINKMPCFHAFEGGWVNSWKDLMAAHFAISGVGASVDLSAQPTAPIAVQPERIAA